MSKFKVEGIGTTAKELTVTGPCELTIIIDYDDVDHRTVEREARKLCALLNKHWEKPAERKQKPIGYAGLHGW